LPAPYYTHCQAPQAITQRRSYHEHLEKNKYIVSKPKACKRVAISSLPVHIGIVVVKSIRNNNENFVM